MSKITKYVISDTHFNHADKMVEYCSRKPDYEAELWHNMYQLKEDDMLIHLGDFCIGNDIANHRYLSGMKCRKILVKGNHDKKTDNFYLTHGWDFVCKHFSLDFGGKYLIFSHRPTRIKSYDWIFNIHGHMHDALTKGFAGEQRGDHQKEKDKADFEVLTDRHRLISCEVDGLKPLLLETIVNKL